MARSVTLGIVGWLAAACAAPAPDTDGVYRGLVRDLAADYRKAFPEDGPHDRFVVSTERAEIAWAGKPEPKRWGLLHADMDGLRRDTYDSFWRRQAIERIEAAGLAKVDDLHVRVLTGAEVDAVLNSVEVEFELERYSKAFPDSVFLQFSGIGFSDDRRQALVFVEAVGWYGSYYLLEQKGGRWKIVDDCEVWVS